MRNRSILDWSLLVVIFGVIAALIWIEKRKSGTTLVAGTGQTVAELQDAGYSSDEIQQLIKNARNQF